MVSITEKPAQIIEGRHLDPRKLVRLLEEVHGENNFRVELRLDRYKIYLSDEITEDTILSDAQIQDCRVYRQIWRS